VPLRVLQPQRGIGLRVRVSRNGGLRGMKKPVQHEKVVQAHVVTLLRSAGGKVFVMGTRRRGADYQGTMQTPGIPDLMAFLPTRGEPGRFLFLFIECKRPGGRMSAEQKDFRALCLAAGVEHVVGDLDATIAWLVAHDYARADQFPHYRVQQVTACETRV
jgi:hypothetical protein